MVKPHTSHEPQPLSHETPPRAHLRWADLIKNHHHDIQERWCTGAAETVGGGQKERGERETTLRFSPIPPASSCSHGGGRGKRRSETTLLGDDLQQKGRSSSRKRGTPQREDCEDVEQMMKHWENIVASPEQKKRRIQYAEAMHHLATTYWEQPEARTSEKGKNKEEEEEAEERNTSTRTPVCMRVVSSVQRRRRYDDRVQMCLDCLSTYFIGIPIEDEHRENLCLTGADKSAEIGDFSVTALDTRSGDHPKGTTKNHHDTPSAGPSCLTLTSSPSSSLLLSGAMLFQTPPIIFSTVSKTMRRHFFQLHHRMATPREVEHLMWGLPLRWLRGGENTNNTRTSTLGNTETENSPQRCPLPAWCTVCRDEEKKEDHTDGGDNEKYKALKEERQALSVRLALRTNGAASANTAYDQARQYIQRRLIALGLAKVEKEEGDNEAVHSGTTTRLVSTVKCSSQPSTTKTIPTAPSLPPSPLHILDVGSCYGPFHGAHLRDKVPLVVTSLDLEPYQDPLVDEIPLVLAADWLTTPVEYVSSSQDKPLNPPCSGSASASHPPVLHWRTTTGGAAGDSSTPAIWLDGGRVEVTLEEEEEEVWQDTRDGSDKSRKNGDHHPFATQREKQEMGVEDSPPSTPTKKEKPEEMMMGDEEHRGEEAKSKTVECVRVRRRRYRAMRIAAESYDGVIFCLLLSYLPSPALRYLACLHAFLALKEGGLLVLLSTRTQGSRRVPWVEQWIATIETIGFERVHVQTREKIVILSFKKRSDKSSIPPPALSIQPMETPPDGGIPFGEVKNIRKEDVEKWKMEMLTSPAAHSGLTITADHQL